MLRLDCVASCARGPATGAAPSLLRTHLNAAVTATASVCRPRPHANPPLTQERLGTPLRDDVRPRVLDAWLSRPSPLCEAVRLEPGQRRHHSWSRPGKRGGFGDLVEQHQGLAARCRREDFGEVAIGHVVVQDSGNREHVRRWDASREGRAQHRDRAQQVRVDSHGATRSPAKRGALGRQPSRGRLALRPRSPPGSRRNAAIFGE